MCRVYQNVLFIYLSALMLGFNDGIKIPEIMACPETFTPLGSTKNMITVVDVIAGSSVYLCCHFCKEIDNIYPKVWYYKPTNLDSPKEIIRRSDIDANKISVTATHTLELNDFNRNDFGIYICQPDAEGDEEAVFTYVLDGIFNDGIGPCSGTMRHWQEYKRNQIDQANEKFERSQEEPFVTFRNSLKFSFRVVTLWESWGLCKPYNGNKGIRKKLGKCRLHPIPYKRSGKRNIMNKINDLYLNGYYDVSCRSITLNETLPEISKFVRHIPEYEATEFCNISQASTCYSNEKEKDYKYKVIKQVAENGRVTLICPEVTLQSNIEWHKNNLLLNSSFRNNMGESQQEPHLTIDSSNLHILHATKNEIGIYTCTVNGRIIKKFEVKIIAKSKLLNDEFIRYSIYLGFVLLLTMACYCAGICVAWHRRTSFADPLNLNISRNKF